MKGMACEVKNGIMRCAAVTNTTTMQPHSADSTQVRATSQACSSVAASKPHRHSRPQPRARPTARGCNWSASRLRSTMRQKWASFQVSPTAANNTPPRARVALARAPASHSSQPSACSSSAGRSAASGGGSTRNHLGAAVNRKPAKNRGMKPYTMAAACATEGGSAAGRAGSRPACPACTSAHQAPEAMSNTMARKNPSRCGANIR